MADLRYSAEIDTRGAVASLNALKSQILGFSSAIGGALAFREISQLSARFEDLRTTLQLLYKDAKTGGAAFDDIKKFAETSIFSVENLTETVVKLKAAGLEPTVKLLTMFADTSSVAADSVGALQAITDLYARTTAGGLGLEDLNRLADRGIPVFTILSERLGISRLEISKLGQTAEGAQVILQALEEGLTQAFGGASANRANNVSQAMSNFGDAVSNAFDVMGQAGLNAGITAILRAFTDMVKILTPLASLIGQALGGAFKFLGENIRPVLYAATAFIAVFSVGAIIGITRSIIELAKGFTLLNAVIGKNPLIKLAIFAATAAASFGLLKDGLEELGLTSEKLGESEGFKVLQEGTIGSGADDLREKAKLLNAELNKFRAEMQGIADSFARYNQQIVDAIDLDTSLIGKSTELRRVREAEADISKRAAEEIAKLMLQKAKLTEQEKKEGRGEIIDATIAKIQQQAEVDKAATAEAIKNSEARTSARKLEEYVIGRGIELQNQLMDIQDQIAKSTMSEIEAKYYDIDRAAQKSAKSAIEAEAARRGITADQMDAASVKAYYDAAYQGSERLKAATKAQYEQSRQFSTGWKQAFKEYADSASNAANVAKTIFNKTMSGLEDLIVDFAKTGKFEWKSFANSMLEELLRIQLRQTFSGILGGITDMFGGGDTGQGRGASANNPVFVADVTGGGAGMMGGAGGGYGSQGGVFGGGGYAGSFGGFDGLLNSINGMFSGTTNDPYGYGRGQDPLGALISGSGWDQPQSNGGGFFSGLWDSVSSGVSDLFSGWFANGGNIPAGTFGIVGERGPELVSGPANVTPMSGMGQNVTYNINAVDAASFKALIASDPGFIHAVAMQGASSIPRR